MPFMVDDEEYDPRAPRVPAPTPAPTPPPAGVPDASTGHPAIPPTDPVVAAAQGGGRNRGGGGGAQGWENYPGQGGPAFRNIPVPGYTPPTFNAPTLADAQNEPGYAFRAQQGREALERSAAARGVLRTGGTLKDLVEYGQNFGAQEYENTFNRALSSYDRQAQAARDKYAPQLAAWQALINNEKARALAAYTREGDAWMMAMQRRGGGGGGGDPYTGGAPPDPNGPYYLDDEGPGDFPDPFGTLPRGRGPQAR